MRPPNAAPIDATTRGSAPLTVARTTAASDTTATTSASRATIGMPRAGSGLRGRTARGTTGPRGVGGS